FTFQVKDDGLTLNGGVDLDPIAKTLSISVNAINDAPTGADKTVTTREDVAYVFATSDFGFSDPSDTQPPSSVPSNSTTPANVTAVNDPPSGADKTVVTAEDVAYPFTAADFGFSDPSDSPANNLLAVRITTLPLVGTLLNNGTPVGTGAFVSKIDIDGGHLTF